MVKLIEGGFKMKAFYGSGELYTKDAEVIYMYHELSFLKDNIYI